MSVKEVESFEAVLESEFEHEPVPASHRRSLLSVGSIWLGFPMVLLCAVLGGVVTAHLGFQMGVLAIIFGNALLAIYVGALSYIAGESGTTFAMQAQKVFGSVVGQWLVALFMSSLVIGWFAFNTGLAGATLKIAYGWPEWETTLVCGVIFIAITFVGARALALLGMIAAPLFIVAAVIAITIATKETGWSAILNYQGVQSGVGAFSFGAGVTFVFASFADSGTMTADFTRWSKNGREALLASSLAFPVGNFIAFISGAIIVATGIIDDPINNGGNFVAVFGKSTNMGLNILGVIFVLVSMGSVATHCLYNGAIGWSNLTKTYMRTMCVVLGVIGVAAATAGVWHVFPVWLGILGIFVAPIGAVVIVTLLVYRGAVQTYSDEPERMKGRAVISYCVGAGLAIATHFWAPWLSEALMGIIGAAVTQFMLLHSQPQREVRRA